MATGNHYYKTYIKQKSNPDVDDAKVLKLSKTITFVFAYLTLIPAFDSKQVLNKPVPDITARCGSIGELLDPGITLEKDNKTRCILEHADRNDHRCGMDASGLTDIVEAVYPVVVVTYGVRIIVSLMTYKEKKII